MNDLNSILLAVVLILSIGILSAVYSAARAAVRWIDSKAEKGGKS
jgi:hypothetical protein